MYGCPFQQGDAKSSYALSLPTVFPFKELVSYEDEEEKEEGSSQFDPPLILVDYGDEEILGFEDYGDEELLDFK